MAVSKGEWEKGQRRRIAFEFAQESLRTGPLHISCGRALRALGAQHGYRAGWGRVGQGVGQVRIDTVAGENLAQPSRVGRDGDDPVTLARQLFHLLDEAVQLA